MCFCIYIFICVLPDPLIFARREKKHTHAHTLIVIKANTHTHRHVPGLSSFYIWTYSPPSSPAEGLREITQRRGETKEGVGVLKNKQQQHVFTFSSSVTTTSSWQIIMWGGWGGGGEDAGVAVNFSTPPPYLYNTARARKSRSPRRDNYFPPQYFVCTLRDVISFVWRQRFFR